MFMVEIDEWAERMTMPPDFSVERIAAGSACWRIRNLEARRNR
jgi:hypothetical protein